MTEQTFLIFKVKDPNQEIGLPRNKRGATIQNPHKRSIQGMAMEVHNMVIGGQAVQISTLVDDRFFSIRNATVNGSEVSFIWFVFNMIGGQPVNGNERYIIATASKDTVMQDDASREYIKWLAGLDVEGVEYDCKTKQPIS